MDADLAALRSPSTLSRASLPRATGNRLPATGNSPPSTAHCLRATGFLAPHQRPSAFISGSTSVPSVAPLRRRARSSDVCLQSVIPPASLTAQSSPRSDPTRFRISVHQRLSACSAVRQNGFSFRSARRAAAPSREIFRCLPPIRSPGLRFRGTRNLPQCSGRSLQYSGRRRTWATARTQITSAHSI